jgi:uncharacterized protein (TIGR02145 family)
MAIKTDGTLWAWGKNVVGELGNNGAWSDWNPVPQRIGTASNWKSVTAGDSFTVARTTDGVLWTWGYNQYGYLGDGTTTNRKPPQAIAVTGRAPVVISKPELPKVSIQTGWFVDSRDGQVYRTVKIGNLTWMAENLKFEPPMVNYSTGTAYNRLMGGENTNLALYGRYYEWDAAIKACPPGWRLPTRGDWENLARTIGGIRKTEIDSDTKDELLKWEGAGLALKSKTGWRDWFGESGNGPNDLQFSAMPGGHVNHRNESSYPESYGRWWTATESSRKTYAYNLSIGNNSDILNEAVSPKGFYYSVRAVTENPPAMRGTPPPEDRSNLSLTHFSVPKTILNRNEDYEVFFRFKNMMNWRSFNVYVLVQFLDKDDKIASSFGGAVVDLAAGAEDARRSINIDAVFLRHLDPGQYQIRINIQYYVNGVHTNRPITQALPGVPATLNVTVSNVPVPVRPGER